MGRYSPIMRRRAGQLLGLEVKILEMALILKGQGHPRFHGFHMATQLDGAGASTLIAHGTLYKALSRLEEGGLLARQWEDPEVAEAEARPRRKYYWLTSEGQL